MSQKSGHSLASSSYEVSQDWNWGNQQWLLFVLEAHIGRNHLLSYLGCWRFSLLWLSDWRPHFLLPSLNQIYSMWLLISLSHQRQSFPTICWDRGWYKKIVMGVTSHSLFHTLLVQKFQAPLWVQYLRNIYLCPSELMGLWFLPALCLLWGPEWCW